jgi:hypothetical protein
MKGWPSNADRLRFTNFRRWMLQCFIMQSTLCRNTGECFFVRQCHSTIGEETPGPHTVESVARLEWDSSVATGFRKVIRIAPARGARFTETIAPPKGGCDCRVRSFWRGEPRELLRTPRGIRRTFVPGHIGAGSITKLFDDHPSRAVTSHWANRLGVRISAQVGHATLVDQLRDYPQGLFAEIRLQRRSMALARHVRKSSTEEMSIWS